MRRLAGVFLVIGAVLVPWPAARAQEPPSGQIHDDYFTPVPITVPLGGSVTWTNKGTHQHSVTADGGEFDSVQPGTSCVAVVGGSGCLNPGDQFTVTFNAAGRYAYHCSVHGSNMVGSVVVESPTSSTDTTTTTTSETTTTIASSASDTSTSLGSDQPTITQAPLPSMPSTSEAALPHSIIRAKTHDDLRPWVFLDVAIAGGTTLAGIVLVRRGRVPFG
jgi:plastocyanin